MYSIRIALTKKNQQFIFQSDFEETRAFSPSLVSNLVPVR